MIQILVRQKLNNRYYWVKVLRITVTIQRFITGIILALLVLTIIFLNDTILYIFILLVAICLLCEWYDMTQSDIRFVILGLPIISIPLASIVFISMMPYGQNALLLFASIIASVDTMAMIGGQFVKGPKLAPRLSPNKTWSGLLIGAISGGIISFSLSFVLQKQVMQFEHWQFLIFGIMLGLVEQMSDLFISSFKRRFKIKDTGRIIPGHGGMLDRLDGIILTAPILLYILNQCMQN